MNLTQTDIAVVVRKFVKDFLSKCDQICSMLHIWSYLLTKSLMENFIFYAVCALDVDLEYPPEEIEIN